MWENTALIVVDVQYGLFIREIPIYEEKALIMNINNLIEKAHTENIPVFFIQHCSARLKEGTSEWDFHPKLEVNKEIDDFITKTKPNSFLRTPLKNKLDVLNITKLVIVGIWTHNCVQATCKGAKKLGYEVILVRDGHSLGEDTESAKKSIESWNKRLSSGVVELKYSKEIDFKN
ncbi:MAG: isochorismatase family protein [Candidatus Hodarchaeales archaeon]|jgi:nicotinamidase-related amidase